MIKFVRLCDITLVFVSLFYLKECTDNVFQNIDKNYYLATEAYNVAKHLFNQGRANYISLKDKSLYTIDTFLDLVYIMNEEMAKELRSAVLKYYKIKYFRDFTNFMITMEELRRMPKAKKLYHAYWLTEPQLRGVYYPGPNQEMIDVIEHCLVDPVEKLAQIRTQFHSVIKNFEDVRNFDTVSKCHKELPDEVAAAHCLLHQAVLFNETMQENLVTIVEIKTRQHAQDMNASLYNVQACISDFVPKFFDQLLLDAYTDKCGYLRIVNASIADLIKDKWRYNQTLFPEKWSPLVRLLKEKTRSPKQQLQGPLFLTLFAANLSSQDILNTLYKH